MARGLLFLCVANSARSQMAEGLARHILGPEFNVQSAGSSPSKVNPFAVKALAEMGIESSSHSSKAVDDIDPASVDIVITLCQEEVCPVFLHEAKREHWPMPDPASAEGSDESILAAFIEIRDQIAERIRAYDW